MLSKTPLVSVKMITYNHEPYIAQAIEGVLMQETEFPIELIIGEDCSTDRTREIVFEYQKKHPNIIRVITSDHNIGATKNSCRTERACRGKYVAFCEGDDYWHNPKKLQKQVDFLELNTDYGVVHSDYVAYEVSRKKRWPTRKLGALDDENAYEEIITGKRIVRTVTVCVRGTILRKAIETSFAELYNLEWPMGDLQRWFEFAKLAKVKYIDEKLATRNMLPESASRSKSNAKLLDFWCRAYEMRLHYLRKYPISKEDTSNVLLSGLSRIMYFAYRCRRWDLVRDSYDQLRKKECHLRCSHYLYYYSSCNFFMYVLLYPVILSNNKLLKKIRKILRIKLRLR